MAIKPYMKHGKKMYLVEVKMRDRDGKQIFRCRQGITSERKAEDAAFELRKELELLINKKPILSWKAWLEKCLVSLKKQYQPSTYYSYEKCLNKYVQSVWDGKDITTITQDDVRELIFEKLPEEATPHTRKHTLKLVRRIFQLAIDSQLLAMNPCAGITVKAPVNDQEVLNPVEVDKLLSEAKVTGHYFYPVWVTGLKTGMRSGEMISLLWSDVDFEAKMIHVNKSWSSKNGLKSTKNERNRVVPISEDFLVFLKGLKLKADPGEPHVLPQHTEWKRGEQAKVLREFCQRIKITSIRFHDLRATFITNMLAQGVALSRVMAIVGHSDSDTTDGYNRRAGIDLKGATDHLAYDIPTFNESEVIRLDSHRRG